MLHEFAFSEIDVQSFEEIFAFGEYVNFFVFIGTGLIEDVSLSAVIHAFHDFLLAIDNIIPFFLKDVTLEVVFMVGLPRVRTHIAEVLATPACHEIAAHRSLYCLLTPRTYLRILRNPLGISFFLHHLLDPSCFLLAFARIVIIALASEAKDLTTGTFNCIELHVHLNAVATISPSAELIITVNCYEILA